MKNSESGHAKTVANFGEVVIKCESYGQDYNPSVIRIQLPAIKTSYIKAQSALKAINSAEAPLKKAIEAREGLFSPLGKKGTKLINALKACQATPATLKNARSIVNKLQGKRQKPVNKPSDQENAVDEKKTVSTSQTSFDNRINHFDRLINLLENTPEYNPNENELKIATLKAYQQEMMDINESVIKASSELNRLRQARNEALYNEQLGLVALANSIKSYMKSVYGTNHPRSKELSKISFKKLIR